MKINKLFGVEGAKNVKGTTVIIDVFRAATVAAFLLDKGVKEIIPVSTAEEAFKYKEQNPNYILLGEDGGHKIEGFDMDNSPFNVSKTTNLEGKTVIHRTSQGTQGIVNAKGAKEIIFGSFVTAGAISEYIKSNNPDDVSIVAMDDVGTEDDVFADFLISSLKEEEVRTSDEITTYLSKQFSAQKFLDPNISEFSKEDFYLSLDIDRFNFVPAVQNGKIIKYTNPLKHMC